jgi:hypothetical protein
MVEEAEGCLLWLEEPAERREVLRLLRNCRPSTVLAMLCREKRLCGVLGGSYWLVTGGAAGAGAGAGAGAAASVGGVRTASGSYSADVERRVSAGAGAAGGSSRLLGTWARRREGLLFLPKKDGFLKMLVEGSIFAFLVLVPTVRGLSQDGAGC